ncbi:hypothetical protein cypCar_00009517, partial [Cyprinus carpio]
MTWNETRKWCLTEYTDIVMVHNENVTYFLKNNLKEKSSSPYYWIGLRKIKETFTWAANGQSVNYENWAPNEPNNNKANENCVELYTSTNNKGKWNDDSCKNKKHPVCHKGVQCLPIIDAPGSWSMNCTHPFSINSFNSSCEFKCEEGFELKGSNTTWCNHTGQWTHKPPTCT